jgi:hypothetical protein
VLSGFTGSGGIDLTNAIFGRLAELADVWSLTSHPGRWWVLDGLMVHRIWDPSREDCPSPNDRIQWLSSTGEGRTTAAPRSVWRQIATGFEADGNDEAAVDVLVAMRRIHDPRVLRYGLAPIRQGYAPQRALYGLLGVLAVTFLIVTMAARQGRFWANNDIGQYSVRDAPASIIDSKNCVHWEYPCMRPGLYALETVIPIIDLDSRSHWTIDTTRNVAGWSDVIAWAIALLRLASWALGGLFLIGLLHNVIETRLNE